MAMSSSLPNVMIITFLVMSSIVVESEAAAWPVWKWGSPTTPSASSISQPPAYVPYASAHPPSAWQSPSPPPSSAPSPSETTPTSAPPPAKHKSPPPSRTMTSPPPTSVSEGPAPASLASGAVMLVNRFSFGGFVAAGLVALAMVA